ncbi:MAG TPA: hypothetical protein VFQ71_10235 [Gaiellales bacterium]|nr:hypothetical protein [Gaiellales bacterium]
MGVPSWSAYDEGYLRAYQWAGALAGGAQLPQAATTVPLGPGEVANAVFASVGLAGYFGENTGYRPSFFLFGGPVGLAVTGAASLAHNASRKAEAQRAAIPSWHPLGTADIVVTNQRLVASGNGQTASVSYAETGPLQMAVGAGGVPAVQFQAQGHPPLRLESAWAAMLYVFVHYHVDGQAPGVPMPAGVLDRARAQGRIS